MLVRRRETKERKLAENASYTKLFRDDYQSVHSLMKDGGKSEAEVIRQLVSEALRSRRLGAHGLDQTKKIIQMAQKKVVEELLAPIHAKLDAQQIINERVEDRVAEGFERVERQFDFSRRALGV